MKIERSKLKRGQARLMSEPARRPAHAKSTPFVDALREVELEAARRDVEPDFDAVEAAGKKLRDSPTAHNLLVYKEAVQRLLSKVLKTAYAVEELRSFNRQGRQTIAVLVRTIDQELDELARLVLTRSQDTLAIAAKIDDIRGLLVDSIR